MKLFFKRLGNVSKILEYFTNENQLEISLIKKKKQPFPAMDSNNNSRYIVSILRLMCTDAVSPHNHSMKIKKKKLLLSLFYFGKVKQTFAKSPSP